MTVRSQTCRVERSASPRGILGLRALSFCAAVAVAAAGPSPAGEGGVLTVRFTGLDGTGGEVLFSLADSEKTFVAERETFRGARVPARGAEAVAVFEDLPAGDYAVKVFHDANGNEKLDIGLMGPKEKYGFSNNVMGFMGPPDFDDAKFAFDGDEFTTEIVAR